MAPSRTRTVKNKHAAPKTSSGSERNKSATDGVSKSRKPKGTPPSKQVRGKTVADRQKKPKKKSWTAEELGVPTLNMITPVGVTKPRGKKKGKVFVDDPESMNTIMSMVQAEKDGQIESKMMKARQMEEIREARKAEAEKKDQERQARLEDTKDSMRKKRKRKSDGGGEETVRHMSSAGSKAKKPGKRVSFA